MGSNPKTEKNEPNRSYPFGLDVRAIDVYLRGEHARKEPQTPTTSGDVKIILPQETAQTLATSGNVRITLPHKSVNEAGQILATNGNMKITHNLDKEQVLGTNRYNIDTQKLDFPTTNFLPTEIEQRNHDLVKHVNGPSTDEDSGLLTFLEPKVVQLFSFWYRTPQQMRRFIGIILDTKYKVEKDHWDVGVYIPLDDEELKPLMTKTLRRHFNTLRSDERHIKDAKNYPCGTMQNLFGIWWNKQAARGYAAKHPKEQDADNKDL